MDQIDSKLNSNNAVFISHGISKILEAIAKEGKLDNYNGNMSQVPELKYLLSKCRCDNLTISTTAFEALINLVEIGSLGTNTTLSNFVMMLGTGKNETAVTSAISNILILDLKRHNSEEKYVCPFTLKMCQHPLITILIHHEKMWKDVLGQIHFIMNHNQPKIALYREEFLRPVFLHILCSPASSNSESCRQHAWHLLIFASDMNELKLEIVQWFRTIDDNVCMDSNYRLLELAEVAVAKGSKDWSCVLMPLLANFAKKLIIHGRDPRTNLCMISEIVDIIGDDYSCEITLALLTETSCLCPVNYLYNIVKTCSALLRKLQCRSIFAHALVSSLLHWITYPSLLLSDAIDDIRNLIDWITSKNVWPTSTQRAHSIEFSILRHSQSDFEFYAELSESLDPENVIPWLKNMSDTPKELKSKCKLILNGLFLQSDDVNVVKPVSELLTQIANEDKDFCCQFLSSVLHKLTKTRDYGMCKVFLFVLPELIGSRENVPVIISVFRQLLSADKPLRYMALELYVRAWKHEKKCHRHLVEALSKITREDDSWQASLTCAKVMKAMCETRPEACIDLVQMLSQILNKCSDVHGSGASSLALDGISALCKHEVIDAESTWQVLAPKLNKDNRAMVLKSLCTFLGSLPTYMSTLGDDSTQFLDNIQTKLWSLVISDNLEVAKAAIRALSSFQLENVTSEMLPEILVDQSCVPNVCWVWIMENVNPEIVSCIGDLLIGHMKIQSYPCSIYKQSPEPSNFTYLPENSIARAIGEYLRCFKTTNHVEVVVECLRIFGQKYSKPVPPVKWNIVEKFLTLSGDARKHAVSIVCHQALISLSAKNLLEKYLASFNDKSKDSLFHATEARFFYANLESICRNDKLSQSVLRSFLQVSSEFILRKAISNDEVSVDIFKWVMMNIGEALESSGIYEPSKMTIYEILENILDSVKMDSKLFEYAVSAVKMPNAKEEILKTSLFTKWRDFSTEKLQKLIVIETEFMLKNLGKPLWMINLINAVLPEPKLYDSLLKSVYEIHSKMELNESSVEWILHLMNWIWMMTDESKIESCRLLCDVLLINTICLSRVNLLLADNGALTESKMIRTRLFPQALRRVSESAHNKDVQKIVEWLNHAQQRTSLDIEYRLTFHNSIVALKYTKHFTENWAMYVIDKVR